MFNRKLRLDSRPADAGGMKLGITAESALTEKDNVVAPCN
jgi:hypothetical protein